MNFKVLHSLTFCFQTQTVKTDELYSVMRSCIASCESGISTYDGHEAKVNISCKHGKGGKRPFSIRSPKGH